MMYIVALISFCLGMITMWLFFRQRYDNSLSEPMLEKQLTVALKAGNTSVWGLDLDKQEIYNIKGHILESPRMPLEKVKPLFYSDDDLQRFMQAIDDVVSEKVDVAEITVRYKSYVTGNYEYIRKFITAQKNKRGKVVSLVGTHKTITHEVEIRKKLEEAKLKAEESEQFKMLFLASMSHEIRTPLNAITGFSNLLHEVDDPEERNAYLEIINTNSDLLLTLVNDILDLSKIENGDIQVYEQKVDLVQDMRNFERIAKNLARKKKRCLHIDVKHPYQKLVVSIDKEKYHRVLYNFLTNAVKYTHEQGTIEIQYEYKNGRIHFSVKDNGIGIPDNKKDRVFSRFEKLDHFAQGTGLGLSLCKSLIHNLGGDIGFESEEGKGSIFWAEINTECFALAEA